MNKDNWLMEIVDVIAKPATCIRRKVGCVLVNDLGHIIATGYNGVAKGLPHCNGKAKLEGTYIEKSREYPHACKGAFMKSGEGHDLCEAIHAEQNALLQCANVMKIKTCYVSTSPCITCTKLLLNTSCHIIIFREDHISSKDSRELWEKAGRVWTQV
jgi:dCMP deaminase